MILDEGQFLDDDVEGVKFPKGGLVTITCVKYYILDRKIVIPYCLDVIFITGLTK